MIRKSLSLLCIAVFLYNLCGYYFIFLSEQNNLRDEMECEIHSGKIRSHAEIIVISDPGKNPDFRWIDKNEFIFKNHLYDIVSIKVSGQDLIITCINDNKEEKLISDYSHNTNLLSENSTPARSHHSQVLSQLIITSALLSETSGSYSLQSSDFKFNEYISQFSYYNVTPLTPPPRV
ncbi:MAG: hypothetical protein Q8867_05205 [Bacteroidota bacterium]|nr:hypothetical protein [Bacteroidota bacterium]